MNNKYFKRMLKDRINDIIERVVNESNEDFDLLDNDLYLNKLIKIELVYLKKLNELINEN